MTQPTIASSTWEKLAKHEKLTPHEERMVIHHIWKGGSFGDVKKVSTALRNSSDHFRDKSQKEMFQVVADLKKGMIIEGTKGIDQSFYTQMQAAQRTAQANRIENQARRAVVEFNKPMPNAGPYDLKQVIPNEPRHKHYAPNYPMNPTSGWC
jgi:hypothetical protein